MRALEVDLLVRNRSAKLIVVKGTRSASSGRVDVADAGQDHFGERVWGQGSTGHCNAERCDDGLRRAPLVRAQTTSNAAQQRFGNGVVLPLMCLSELLGAVESFLKVQGTRVDADGFTNVDKFLEATEASLLELASSMKGVQGGLGLPLPNALRGYDTYSFTRCHVSSPILFTDRVDKGRNKLLVNDHRYKLNLKLVGKLLVDGLIDDLW